MTGLLGGLGPGPTRKLWPDLEHPLQDPALVTLRVTIRLRDGMDQSIERRAARA